MFVPIFRPTSPINAESDGNDFTAVMPLAFCGDTNRLITVDAKLAFINDIEIQLENGLINEFSYEFTVAYIDGTQPSFRTQDRGIVASYLDDPCRSIALPAVLRAIPVLVAASRPQRIYRVTKRGNLPAPALVKHNLVTRAFEDLGYVVVTCERDTFSRDFWVMER